MRHVVADQWKRRHATLTEAVQEPADSAGLFTALLDRFGMLGGVDLDLPAREGQAPAADFTARSSSART